MSSRFRSDGRPNNRRLQFGPAQLDEAVGVTGQEAPARHGMSAFGDLKYPPDFKHFDYVDPNAPKGGAFSHVGPSRAFNQNFLTYCPGGVIRLPAGEARLPFVDVRDIGAVTIKALTEPGHNGTGAASRGG